MSKKVRVVLSLGILAISLESKAGGSCRPLDYTERLVSKVAGIGVGDGAAAGAGSTLCRDCPSAQVELGASMPGRLSQGDCALTDSSLFDAWSFDLAAPSTVVIALSSREFDTFLMIADANCLVIDFNDDCVGAIHGSCLSIALPPGSYTILVNAFAPDEIGSYDLIVDLLSPEARFVRGDANADVQVDISDAVTTLLALFTGGAVLPCLDAADTDDSGAIDVTDPIVLLNFLFRNGPPPSPPFSVCSVDPSTDDELGCELPAECAME
jgi:hypothetical protein